MREQRMRPFERRAATIAALGVLAACLVAPAGALAQPPVVPTVAALYGVHETTIYRALPAANPFRDVTLNATYFAPSGQRFDFWGFYDGDGAGGMTGPVWKIRFMPNEVGPWTMSWTFTDGVGNSPGSFTFTTNDTGIRGPAKLDPGNPQLFADARGNPIHWRGYGIKHRGATYLDPPVVLSKATDFINQVIQPQLIGGGYNAAYVTVPTGWTDGTCSVESMAAPPPNDQLDCPLWGNYFYYSLKASHFFDRIINHLHQNGIWTIGWITFGLQSNWPDLSSAANYQPLMKYFVARYGAYYNFFMWSPTWEVFELQPDYWNPIHAMMDYLVSIDPWKRLQGPHDRAQVLWGSWQRILPRQQPSRSIFHGNNRTTGVYSGPSPIAVDYPYAIIGAEDLWEFCPGVDDHLGKPRNATEVRRGLIGALFANVLPVYDEHFEDNGGPCGPGVGNGAGEGYVQALLNWWYATVNYRNPAFTRLNHLTSAALGQILSGIPGQEYVLYREGSTGAITINLSGTSGVFNFWAYDAVNLGVPPSTGQIAGGQSYSLPSPFAGDTLVFLRKQ